MANIRAQGILQLTVGGVIYDAKGSWTYNLGRPRREGIAGADRVHGYKEMPQVPFIEGAITDRGDLQLEQLVTLDNATVSLKLRNGKTIVLSGAWYAGEGSVTTEEGEIAARFEGVAAEELAAA